MNRQDVKRKIIKTISSLANYNLDAWNQVGPGIQFALILGLALIESLALYTLVIIFAKVK